MLPLILYKSLQATPFQISFIIGLKPAVSILSIYWSARVNARPERLVSNILMARLLGCLPFIAFFLVPNVWLIIAAAALYMMLAVGVVPAWMELLKRNIDNQGRKSTFAYGSALGYLGGGLLPLAFGVILDQNPAAWSWLFTAAGAVALSALVVQSFLRVTGNPTLPEPASISLVAPWSSAYRLLRSDSSFLSFQATFMVMGTGLMVIQPALPIYFVDQLGMSYFELGIALALCKGLSYAAASPLWAQWLGKVDIFRFTATVAVIAVCFPLLLLAAANQPMWLYIAYVVYGIMQAGSEMSWNMSGPIFAGESDSSLYTSVNIVSVGLRGCVIPAVGSLFCTLLGAPALLAIGAMLFLTASYVCIYYRKKWVLNVNIA